MFRLSKAQLRNRKLWQTIGLVVVGVAVAVAVLVTIQAVRDETPAVNNRIITE